MDEEARLMLLNFLNAVVAGVIAFTSSMGTILALGKFEVHDLLISASIAACTSVVAGAYLFQDYLTKEIKDHQPKMLFKFI